MSTTSVDLSDWNSIQKVSLPFLSCSFISTAILSHRLTTVLWESCTSLIAFTISALFLNLPKGYPLPQESLLLSYRCLWMASCVWQGRNWYDRRQVAAFPYVIGLVKINCSAASCGFLHFCGIQSCFCRELWHNYHVVLKCRLRLPFFASATVTLQIKQMGFELK